MDIEELINLAKQGDIDAQKELSERYLYDRGIKRNLVESNKWLKKVAEQGSAADEYKLGKQLCHCKDIMTNTEEGVSWLRKAAEQGYAKAQYYLGWCYYIGKTGRKRNYNEAIKWFKKAAEQGLEAAQEWETSYNGEMPNFVKFFDYNIKLAEQGDAEALWYLSQCYLEGCGIPQNSDAYIGCIEKSALLGYEKAQMIMGKMYEHGGLHTEKKLI